MVLAKKVQARLRRHRRVRRKVKGTPDRPRLCIFRSSKHIYAQIIDDVSGRVLASASSLTPEIRSAQQRGSNVSAAAAVGELIGKKAREAQVEQIVFDRGGYLYHGRVRALAEAAREQGLKF